MTLNVEFEHDYTEYIPIDSILMMVNTKGMAATKLSLTSKIITVQQFLFSLLLTLDPL